MTYDPVRRVVALSNPNPSGGAWLKVGLTYDVRLGLPEGDSDLGGIRAIDRATLDPNDPNRVIGFRIAAETFLPPPPQVAFCNDVLPIFEHKCSGSVCHGAPTSRRPRAGLILSTSLGVANTAVGRVSQGANTTSQAGVAQPATRIFGVNMPIVDPGNPGQSWLLYKLLLAVPPETSEPSIRERCDLDTGTPPFGPLPGAVKADGTVEAAPFVAAFQLVTAEERARLSNEVLGREMPYPSSPGDPPGSPTDNPPLTYDELERVRLWIAQGARVPECGACQE